MLLMLRIKLGLRNLLKQLENNMKFQLEMQKL